MISKKLLVLIVVSIMVIGGGIAYAMSLKNTKPVTTAVDTSNSVGSVTQSPKTLKEMLTSGVSQTCTYNDTIANSEVSGTSYVAGGKVRADFSSTSEGKVTRGHTIFDGTVSYIWMDDTKTGFKFEIDPAEIKTDSNTEVQGFDLNNMAYDCKSWNVDDSMFEVPADVTFSGFSVPTGNQGTQMTGNQNLCASCDSLSGDQKTQCLAALKCN
jgi:hypothetical protein